MTTDHPAVVAIGVFLAYMVLVGVIWQVTGTRYDALVDSRAHVLRGIVLPIGLGALLLAIATTWLGWWNSALFEGSRSGPGWALVVPALFAAVAVINIATIDYRSPQATLLPLVFVGCLLVGFAEELATRGLLGGGLARRWQHRGGRLADQLSAVLVAACDECVVRTVWAGNTDPAGVGTSGRHCAVRHPDDHRHFDRRDGATCGVGLRNARHPGNRCQAKTPAGPDHFTPNRSTIQPTPRKAMAAESWNSEASRP